jgi:poly-gamma-glutamate capsule biosynthesis protein CapA/YwtB (metallophosphatase superfamily)
MKKISIYILLALVAHTVTAQDTTRLSLMFLGDIMQHDSQISDAYDHAKKTYDYDPCFQYIKNYTQSVDLAIANLELTLAGPPYRGYPQFSAPDALLTGLQNMGLDVLVTANNHCVDTGKKGLERTIRMLDSLKIPHTGTFTNEEEKVLNHPLMVKRNGFNLAILNYTFSTNGLPVSSPNIVNRIDTAVIRRDLQKAKSLKPDLITVFFHWGNEYESLPSPWQKIVAEHSFKNGAQLVIGAHPHVIQPMEWRKDKNQLIVYSLGNFVSGQRKRYTDGGAMVRIQLEKISNDDSSVTTIDTANYLLQWVYRDAEKNYYMIPVSRFENAADSPIKGVDNIDAFSTFISDSRELLSKNNIGIQEWKQSLSQPPMVYTVKFDVKKKGADKTGVPVPYEIFTRQDSAGNLIYYSGNFTDEVEANKYRSKVARLGYKDAQVVTLERQPR